MPQLWVTSCTINKYFNLLPNFRPINKSTVEHSFLETSSTIFASLVPSIWFFKFSSRSSLEGTIGRSHCKMYIIFLLYQNDFSSINYGRPIDKKGDSFASNGALIDPTIFIPFANLLMVFNYENNLFPLRNNKLKLGKKSTPFL